MIIGKSSIEQDNYDVVVFCFRNVEHVKIPNFIRIIDSYAFSECQKLKSVEFTSDSELHTISKYAFSLSSITNFSIPRSVKILDEHCFSNCKQFKKIEIPFNSQLQIIGKYAFFFSAIQSFSVPPQLTKICENAFYFCSQLQKFEIPFNSELQVVETSALNCASIESFTIPSKLNQIGKFAFSSECIKIMEINESNEMEYIDKHIFGYIILNIIIMLPAELSGHFNLIFPYLERNFSFIIFK